MYVNKEYAENLGKRAQKQGKSFQSNPYDCFGDGAERLLWEHWADGYMEQEFAAFERDYQDWLVLSPCD